jgi:hypothetical protein
MIRLAERTYEEAARLARDPKTVIVFPLGAIEEHGPHLPLLVDWLGAEELARVIAPYLRRAGWRPVLVPSMPYGASPLAVGWSGTVSLSIGTLPRGGHSRSRPPLLPAVRAHQLSVGSGAPPGHGPHQALCRKARPGAGALRRLRPGPPEGGHGRPPHHGAALEPAAGSSVALG